MKQTQFLTVAEACAVLSVSRKTLYRMIAADIIPAPRRIQAFRQVYFERAAFDAAVKKAMR